MTTTWNAMTLTWVCEVLLSIELVLVLYIIWLDSIAFSNCWRETFCIWFWKDDMVSESAGEGGRVEVLGKLKID